MSNNMRSFAKIIKWCGISIFIYFVFLFFSQVSSPIVMEYGHTTGLWALMISMMSVASIFGFAYYVLMALSLLVEGKNVPVSTESEGVEQ